MKKIINNKINILTFTLIILSFITSTIFSYKDKNKAQEEFINSSLGFLSYKKVDLDKLKEFDKTYEDVDILFKSKDGITYYNSGIDEINIRENEFENEKILKKSKKNYFYKNNNLSAIKIGNDILVLSYQFPSFIFFLFKRLNILFFLLSLIFLLNTLIAENIYNSIINQFKDIFKDYREFAIFSKSPKKYIKEINKKNEELITNSKNLMDMIVNMEKVTSNMEEGFIFFNKDGQALILNEAARFLLNVDKKINIDNLIDDDTYRLALRQTKLLKKGKNIELVLDNYALRLFIDSIIEANVTSYIILVIDDSKNKRAEVMRREFTSNVTHELKSPLTSINGYAELISEGLAKDDDIKEFAKIINEEGNRLLNIIDDILKLSKLDEKNLQEDSKNVNIKEVAQNTIKRFKSISEKKQINIINDLDDIIIKTHESLFIDLFTNIYENAIKYNKINGDIILNYTVDATNINLIIEDTGIGIKKEDIKRIFERFYVVDKQRTRTLKSTGLGLSIVKHICDYLDYDIEVESEFGSGTRFIIKIANK